MTTTPYSEELELTLVHVAQKYAPRIAPPKWKKAGDLVLPLHVLARQLANYHVLVVLGHRAEQRSEDLPAVVRECAEAYCDLYKLLVDVLYPPLKGVKAHYYSLNRSQLLVCIVGDARPVIEVLAGYVVPYVVERQHIGSVFDMEIMGLMDVILKTLDDGGDLTDAERRYLKLHGAAIITRLLKTQLRQLPLTRFDEKLFTKLGDNGTFAAAQADSQDEQHVNPFLDGTADDVAAGDDPEFLRRMNEQPASAAPSSAPQPGPERASAPPPIDRQDEGGETGPNPAINREDEPQLVRRATKPLRETPRSRRLPLPFWDDDRKR